jgi:hypothetical protein
MNYGNNIQLDCANPRSEGMRKINPQDGWRIVRHGKSRRRIIGAFYERSEIQLLRGRAFAIAIGALI